MQNKVKYVLRRVESVQITVENLTSTVESVPNAV